jgi:hypothetical protein
MISRGQHMIGDDRPPERPVRSDRFATHSENPPNPPRKTEADASPQPPAKLQGRFSVLASMFARFSRRQIVLAIAIAAVSDLLGAFVTFAPPVMWIVDFATAVLLFMVLGWQWLLLPGLVMEAIPGLGVVPFWLLVVAGILAWGTARPNLKRLFPADTRDATQEPPRPK